MPRILIVDRHAVAIYLGTCSPACVKFRAGTHWRLRNGEHHATCQAIRAAQARAFLAATKAGRTWVSLAAELAADFAGWA